MSMKIGCAFAEYDLLNRTSNFQYKGSDKSFIFILILNVTYYTKSSKRSHKLFSHVMLMINS
jgi:hypothetical protein